MRFTLFHFAIVAAGLCSSRATDAQTVGVRPVTPRQLSPVRDTALVNALTNAELLSDAEPVSGTRLAVRVFRLPGESGSANDGESDRVIHWLYISVSEFGEAPTQRVYRFGPMYDPKLDSLVSRKGAPAAFITYGVSSHRQHAVVVATLDSARLMSQTSGRP